MICDKCDIGQLEPQKKLYHYLECGLPGVFLENVTVWECPKCQAAEVEIPRIGQLHRCIGWIIVTKPSLLTGPEMVFLRRLLGKSQKKMAEELGIHQVVLSRWETESRKNHTKANDILFRLNYLARKDDEYTHKVNRELHRSFLTYFSQIKEKAASAKIEIDPHHFQPRDIFNKSVSAAIDRD